MQISATRLDNGHPNTDPSIPALILLHSLWSSTLRLQPNPFPHPTVDMSQTRHISPRAQSHSQLQTVPAAGDSSTDRLPRTLRLRAEDNRTAPQTNQRGRSTRRIKWSEDVVDNEGMGKKSSKGQTTLTSLRSRTKSSRTDTDRSQYAASTTNRGPSAKVAPNLHPHQTQIQTRPMPTAVATTTTATTTTMSAGHPGMHCQIQVPTLPEKLLGNRCRAIS